MVESPPRPDGWDLLAVGSALGLLVVAHVIYPNRLLQYGVWLTVFTIWMAWFVYYGTRWLYGVDGSTK